VYGHICTRVFLVALALSFLIPQTSAEKVSTGIIIPLYTDPGPAWDTVMQEKTAHPLVPIISIINPDNGPGQFYPSYVTGIQQLQSAGILVLGYVDTSYGSKNATSVESEIDSYNTWYHVNGIFFDQMSYVAGNEAYYLGLTQYSKSLGMTITVGNSGTDTVPSYVGTVDNIVTYESAGLPPLSALDGWHTSYAKGNFSMIAFGVDELNESFVKYASNYVGYMYVTNYTLPNPYYDIPLYLDNLTASLPQSISLTVRAVDTMGNAVTGVPVLVRSLGLDLANSTLPYTVGLGIGQAYDVIPQDFDGYVFDHWQQNVSLSRDATVSPLSDTVLVAVYRNTLSCLPPASGDWVVTSSCTLGSSAAAPANIIVDTGAVLTIPSGLRLDIDFTHYHLLVRAGGGVLIKAGGAIN
jgi:hypothetical protein